MVLSLTTKQIDVRIVWRLEALDSLIKFSKRLHSVHGCHRETIPQEDDQDRLAVGEEGAITMSDDDIKRIPIKDLRREEGASELASSPDMEP